MPENKLHQGVSVYPNVLLFPLSIFNVKYWNVLLNCVWSCINVTFPHISSSCLSAQATIMLSTQKFRMRGRECWPLATRNWGTSLTSRYTSLFKPSN